MKTASDPHNRCNFLFADGRRCRMLQTVPGSTLCPHHQKEELQRREAEKLKAELAGLSGAVNSATQICEVLGKVFNALAEGRISARTANTLGYLGQLMLQNIPIVRHELNDAVGSSQAYNLLLRHQLPVVRKFRKL